MVCKQYKWQCGETRIQHHLVSGNNESQNKTSSKLCCKMILYYQTFCVKMSKLRQGEGVSQSSNFLHPYHRRERQFIGALDNAQIFITFFISSILFLHHQFLSDKNERCIIIHGFPQRHLPDILMERCTKFLKLIKLRFQKSKFGYFNI